MKKIEFEDGGYALIAETGHDLALLDEKGKVIERTKEVLIPAAGTLNTWVEVDEELPVVVNEDAEKAAKIAVLEAELAKLKGATQ